MNWRGVARWGLKIVTVGLVARKAKMKPRDVVPGLVSAVLIGTASKSADYSAILDRLMDQITDLGLDKIESREIARWELRLRGIR